MGFFDVYSYIIANWLNSGAFAKRSRMKATDISPEYNVIYTKDCIKKIYRVTGIKPENRDLSFLDMIRNEMFDRHPNVDVIVSMHNKPVPIDVNSDKFSRQMARANEQYTTYKSMFDSQDGLARLAGKTYRLPGGQKVKITAQKLDDLRQVFLTYYCLYTHKVSGGTVSLSQVFVELCGKDLRELKMAADDLCGLLMSQNMGCSEVKGVTKSYLSEYGPAAVFPEKPNKSFMPQLLFTDTNQTAFNTYRDRGLVGGYGLLFGVDFRSKFPLLVDLFKAPAAQIFCIAARTGEGKTYSAYQLALSAVSNGDYVSAIDIKGREWVKLNPFIPAKTITFDARNPSFVNTLRLDDIVVTKDNAMEFFQTAIKGTVSLLSLIINLAPGEGSEVDLEMILREAVNKLYSIRHVDPSNPSTFAATKSIKYADLLPIIESLSLTNTYTEAQRKMVKLARSRCQAYLGDSGIFAESFKNEISLGEIMDAPFVIYEFNKNQNTMVDSLDVLRIFMVQFLDSKKKAMLREQGKFLFCFYEELQRCDQFGNLLEYICGDVTGSRSNNAVIVLLLNSFKVLEGERARDIRSNITTMICGRMNESDIVTVRESFGREWLASQLELFAKEPDEYRHCFAADIDTGAETLATVFKVELPEYMSEMFKTRTTRESEVS